MNQGNKQKLRKLYQIGIPINEIAELFSITPNEVIKLCKGVKRLRQQQQKNQRVNITR